MSLSSIFHLNPKTLYTLSSISLWWPINISNLTYLTLNSCLSLSKLVTTTGFSNSLNGNSILPIAQAEKNVDSYFTRLILSLLKEMHQQMLLADPIGQEILLALYIYVFSSPSQLPLWCKPLSFIPWNTLKAS